METTRMMYSYESIDLLLIHSLGSDMTCAYNRFANIDTNVSYCITHAL